MTGIASSLKAHCVKEHVLSQVESGVLQHGDCLPSEVELANTLGVGRHSVRLALTELSDAGIVDRKRKRGTMVTLPTPSPKREAETSGFALVIPEMHSGIYPSLIRGFARGSLGSQQHSLVVESGLDIYHQADAILRLVCSRVSGVALVPAQEPMPGHQVQAFRSQGIPLVFCHRKTTALDAPLIKWCWEEAGHLAATTLAELGHRRIAFINNSRSIVTEGYLVGMRKELAHREIPFPAECEFFGDYQLTGAEVRTLAEKVVSRLLHQSERPTAVFCGDDYMSELVFVEAIRAGIRVPQDLSIIGFGPTYRDGTIREGLAAVAVDEVEVGRLAAEILSELASGQRPADDNQEIIMPLTVLRGKSLASPPAR